MAIRYVDGFDSYSTVSQRWTAANNGTIVAGALRTGTAGMRVTAWNNNGPSMTLTAQGTWIVGVAFRYSSVLALPQPTAIIATLDAGNVQGNLRINVDGTLSLYRGATVVATSTEALRANNWYYIEFKHIILNAAGTLEVRVNGVVWATFAGDTQDTVNATANQISLRANGGGGAVNSDIDYDDLVIMDGTGAINNNYLGEVQVETLYPTGAGTYTNWVTLVGAATHWQAVDETPPDDDTTYVADNVAATLDSFAYGNVSVANATIPGVQVTLRMRDDAGGGALARRLFRSGVTDNFGANLALAATYGTFVEVIELDPVAVGAWTVANLNAGEFGAGVV